jgi:hypothetical protein
VKQYSDRFAGFDCMISNGFPIDEECHRLLDEMTHVLTCETPYNRELYIEARRRGIKTYDQYNFEFQDLLIKPKMAQPTKFLAPFLCLPMNEALTSGLPVIMSNVSPNDAILPQEWLVPGAFNGGLTSRVPIQYFNANISVLARKPDELATMSYDVLDQQKTRALELSRQWDPEVLRPQYEAVLAGCRPVALAPRSLEIVSIYERGIRKLLHGDTALLSERTSDRHQSFLGECLKVCFALPDFSGIYASGDVSQHMRD